ncbi:glycoside hydrolase family 36 protein [Halorubrum vacuolatum]|uniref:Alpha-galactosidase n=1 Tax=Halorubrum vacuolatum TaxID=63740 RepID=A0A238XN68_HALVU|nr:glycoside hydrolase family 36 protein [Halorubrum vacuolatum]SNR59903.1 alpha-galactosidase [Halorubrum vacuolatum]
MQEITAMKSTVCSDPAAGVFSVSDGTGTLLSGGINVDTSHASSEVQITVRSAAKEAGGIAIGFDLENVGDDPVRLDRLVLSGETGFGSDARIYRHGYQSWSPSGTLPVGERFPAENPDNAPMMRDLAAPTDRRTSSYLIGLIEAERTLTMGFLTHDRFCTRFDIVDDERGVEEVAAVCPLEGRRLEPGGTLELPTLWIDATRDIEDGLAVLADLIGDRMDARVPGSVPTGWCSWYHYFTDVTEADVRENLTKLQEWGVPVEVVQIDDGYMEAFGDWRSIADGFSEMGELARDIETAGYRPGLWLAPFYVEEEAALYRDHPEWFIRKPSAAGTDQEPVDGGYRAGSNLYGLDTTHPEVQEWLRDTFETVVHDWGFSYLKLDFLFAAALPGERYDPEATRVEAYRKGLDIIAETVGDDVFLLGCGAPLAPSVGFFDAMRIGPDTDPVWETPGESASQPALKNAVRNTLTRQFLHRRWWLNDPDCQLVRETSDLTAAEREAFAVLVAVTGGVNILSDRLAEIDLAGRRLIERSLSPTETGVVEDLTTNEFPSRVVCERPGDRATTVAIFNWEDQPRRIVFDAHAYSDDDIDAHVLWDGVAGDVVDGPVIERELPAHGAAVFAIVPAGPGDLLGDAGTLTGGTGRVDGTSMAAGRLRATVADNDLVFRTEH